jgi:hypothetical protein
MKSMDVLDQDFGARCAALSMIFACQCPYVADVSLTDGGRSGFVDRTRIARKVPLATASIVVLPSSVLSHN